MWKFVGCFMAGMMLMSGFYWHSGASKPVYTERGRKINYVRTPTAEELAEAQKLSQGEATQKRFVDQHNQEMRQGRNSLLRPFNGEPAYMPGADKNAQTYEEKVKEIIERTKARERERRASR